MDLDEQELKATKGIEKTADEMFELLGYIKVEDSKMCITYANDEIDSEINFWKIDKTVSKTHYEKLGYMRMQELKAINKKVEELRMVDGCEYCKEDFDGYFRTLDKNGHVCVFDMAHEKTLDINWYGHKMKIPINYCPMCGRKLV